MDDYGKKHMMTHAVQSDMSGAELIAMERDRQIRVEGFGDAHDDQWTNEELAKAGVYYALPDGFTSDIWPFADEWDKKSGRDRVRQLMVAGAFIAAEIDRLRRISAKEAY